MCKKSLKKRQKCQKIKVHHQKSKYHQKSPNLTNLHLITKGMVWGGPTCTPERKWKKERSERE